MAFADWLGGEGLTRSDDDAAYAEWWERFRANPTGQLEARFQRVTAKIDEYGAAVRDLKRSLADW